ncbi:hypothetical protein RUND412_002237 [Rhizina undulata]
MHISPQPDTKSEDIPFLDLNERNAIRNRKSARKTQSTIAGTVLEQTPFSFSICQEDDSVFVDITPIPAPSLETTHALVNSRRSQNEFSSERPSTISTVYNERAHTPDATECDLICGLCLDILHDPATLDTCRHHFCLLCICDYMYNGNNGILTCPTCEAKYSCFTIDYRMDRTIGLWLKNHPEYELTLGERQWRENVLSLLLAGLEKDCSDMVIKALESYSNRSRFCI